ncbi:MAG: 23S rRNA (pseudouridine(1915)-N(3))-methyltransferase RlmH [Oscillospiraceae bacterium]|nr:23S rRNA (pseudouridine(1915)-N(3))-methyltransferase RlmH [Oscillospiraceae bacterium]
MKIKIVAVGKIKERALSELIAEYVKRLGRYCSLEIVEVADESISARESGPGVMKFLHIEAGRVLERLRAGSYAIALDMGGAVLDSVAFAGKLDALSGHYPEIAFIIGGSHGLHPDVLECADFVLSMSKLTFPHQLARLLVLEQLYRAFKIINNETYHK